MSDNMGTYRAHLSADYLSKHLLMKHVAEVNGGSVIWGQDQVEEDFHQLAERLGYRVEKIEPVETQEAAE